MSDLIYNLLQYQPTDTALFKQAFTHRSFSRDNNERLEFLGDALIDLIIGDALFHQFPKKQEGELSRFRAELVRGSTLADIAREIGLNSVIRLGEGEKKNGGAERESILAGAFEALFGAIYLDSNFEQCQKVALELFAPRIDNILNATKQKDAKTHLQELLQARKIGLPVYSLLRTSGKQHQQVFYVQCEVPLLESVVEASGESKKMAEQQAAKAMITLISEEKL